MSFFHLILLKGFIGHWLLSSKTAQCLQDHILLFLQYLLGGASRSLFGEPLPEIFERDWVAGGFAKERKAPRKTTLAVSPLSARETTANVFKERRRASAPLKLQPSKSQIPKARPLDRTGIKHLKQGVQVKAINAIVESGGQEANITRPPQSQPSAAKAGLATTQLRTAFWGSSISMMYVPRRDSALNWKSAKYCFHRSRKEDRSRR